MNNSHSFHVPVMGTGFTLDTPLKISQYGMDSVISLVDDILVEKLRKIYCLKYEIPYKEISDKIEDFRAKRITSYLNLVNALAEKKFEELKNATIEKGNELKEYFNMLPDTSSIKKEFDNLASKFNSKEITKWIKENLSMGSIDVNIMTKLDKENYKKKEKLPVEFNDAHAALRGYANSDLKSSIVFSAGMNPRLYSYIEKFEDFFPDEHGEIRKKIILKVSDYRSAFIQGKFLAKKGLWISEYRIESGLNCGGHAFATDGYLLGPVLEEFREKREELAQTLHEILAESLKAKDLIVPESILPIRITAQGGVGTAEEHQFLIDEYNLDSVGWGTPFLLVPEVTTVDDKTLSQLVEAREDDLHLSNISPLGVPFNSLKGNTQDMERMEKVIKGRPGSSCPKKFLVSNREFTENTICTASRQYQHLKLIELDEKELTREEHKIEFDKIVGKSCICVGLGTAAMISHKIDTKGQGEGVSICPGPNLAYFSKTVSLKEMIDHIYGRANVISRKDRPNMFVKELTLYIDYLRDKIKEASSSISAKQTKYFAKFIENLGEGIDYYQRLFGNMKSKFEGSKSTILNELEANKDAIRDLQDEVEHISEPAVMV